MKEARRQTELRFLVGIRFLLYSRHSAFPAGAVLFLMLILEKPKHERRAGQVHGAIDAIQVVAAFHESPASNLELLFQTRQLHRVLRSDVALVKRNSGDERLQDGKRREEEVDAQSAPNVHHAMVPSRAAVSAYLALLRRKTQRDHFIIVQLEKIQEPIVLTL